jgi:hypothetical protein
MVAARQRNFLQKLWAGELRQSARDYRRVELIRQIEIDFVGEN